IARRRSRRSNPETVRQNLDCFTPRFAAAPLSAAKLREGPARPPIVVRAGRTPPLCGGSPARTRLAMTSGNPTHTAASKHSVVVRRLLGHRLDHIPVFDHFVS